MRFDPRTCKNEECKAIFIPRVANQVFCCNECRDAFYFAFPHKYYEIKKTKLKVCPECKKEFLSNNRKKVYCTAECQIKHREKAYIKKEPSTRVCPTCKKVFVSAHAHKKFCTNKCRLEAYK